MMTGKRVNGEGSIFRYRNGYAAYVWVTTPTGQKKRKYVYGKTREEVNDKWVQLKAKAAKIPVPTSTPTVAGYLAYWLAEIIRPNREDCTYSHYELMSRLHVIPGIGKKRIDNSLSGKPRHGSTNCPAPASAAPRRKTPSVLSLDAALSVPAVRTSRAAA